jgi:hypothetical protein
MLGALGVKADRVDAIREPRARSSDTRSLKHTTANTRCALSGARHAALVRSSCAPSPTRRSAHDSPSLRRILFIKSHFASRFRLSAKSCTLRKERRTFTYSAPRRRADHCGMAARCLMACRIFGFASRRAGLDGGAAVRGGKVSRPCRISSRRAAHQAKRARRRRRAITH